MAVIADKANRLKKLIEDLIEASKVSSGNIVLNKALLDLNELATQAIVEETTGFEKANLQLVFEEPARKTLFRQTEQSFTACLKICFQTQGNIPRPARAFTPAFTPKTISAALKLKTFQSRRSTFPPQN